jgi:hypothetical protein
MSVEFVPPAIVRDLASRVGQARGAALQSVGTGETDSSKYWIRLFEANASAVLDRLTLVALRDDYVVRYCFYGQQGGDLLVRPFVARSTTDVTMVRRLVDWHPAPDSIAPVFAPRPTKDVELLYSHFHFERSVLGFFEYWIAMQELWSSARWIHSRIIAERQDLDEISKRDGWQMDQTVERCEPALVRLDDGGAQLAVLLYCPLGRAGISLHRVHIGADQAINFVDAIPVAHGRSGYRLQ